MLPISKRPLFIPPQLAPPAAPKLMHLLTNEVIDRRPFISKLVLIRRDLMDATGKQYIGDRTYEDDVYVVHCGVTGLRFIENRCKYVFQAKGCVHSCEWTIDRDEGELSSHHTAVDGDGNEVDFICEYQLIWLETNTRRKEALQLPGFR